MPLERELVAPVPLCRPDGTLNPDAVGWSRRPLHDCAIARWGRRKRWHYWAVTDGRRLVSATAASLDVAGLGAVYLVDFEQDRMREQTVLSPLGRGCTLPDRVHAAAGFVRGRFRIAFDPEGDGMRLRVEGAVLDGEPVEADLHVLTPPGHETLTVVVPWDARRFQLTSKHVALPARGTVRVGDRTLQFDAADTFATLDYGRGVWPYRTVWNWGAGAGRVDGRTIGVQLGGQWTDATGSTENALVVDGRLTKISHDLVWAYDRRAWLRPWRVTAPDGSVDLCFTPQFERVATVNALVVRSEVHQCFGRWKGTVRAADGEAVRVDGCFGWAEDHVARW